MFLQFDRSGICKQARNQLGTPGGRRVFSGPNFLNCPIFSNYDQRIFPGGGEKVSGGGQAPLVTGRFVSCLHCAYKFYQRSKFCTFYCISWFLILKFCAQSPCSITTPHSLVRICDWRHYLHTSQTSCSPAAIPIANLVQPMRGSHANSCTTIQFS